VVISSGVASGLSISTASLSLTSSTSSAFFSSSKACAASLAF
jgi:hypothetical protein